MALLTFLLPPGLGYAAVSAETGFFAGAAAARCLACLHVIGNAPRTAFKDAKGSPCDPAKAASPAPTATSGVILAAADGEGVPEDQEAAEREKEREHAKRLRRARAEQEARRAEAARKLEAERTRQREINRLRATVSGLEQRESFLNHEVLWTRRELDSVSRDPADHSAMARRGGVEHELFYLQNQLNQTTASKHDAVRRLNRLQFR
ncbi:MAG: hypothetical protein A3G24_09050 [Betaproteobacteria bacterium RIFCSPLOWO2_12_FULL_62_13]|nr:MAG: hypothetical protein A3G24_09050 [Betaproteobacteria bacterium RIFCSPLOWO2_12_FULL_62_13]